MDSPAAVLILEPSSDLEGRCETMTDMEMPQPTEEHKRLEELAGVWTVDCTFYMDPSPPGSTP
jgi:hypothetical protein